MSITALQPAGSINSTEQALRELHKLQAYNRHLQESLEAERAKTSKLRRYIALNNQSRTQPQPQPVAAVEDAGLKALVEQQSKMLEQLSRDNEQQRQQIGQLTHQAQQLATAGDKLKARNIDLRRRLRDSEGLTRVLHPAEQAGTHSPEPPAAQTQAQNKPSLAERWVSQFVNRKKTSKVDDGSSAHWSVQQV